MKGISRRARTCAAVAGFAVLAASGTAQAQTKPEKVGDGVPTGQLGVQMFNYGTFISSGGNAGTPSPITNIAPATDGTQCVTSQANAGPGGTPPADPPARLADCRKNRLEALFGFLQRKGLTNIEIFGHAGFPAQSDVAGLTAYRALLDKYGLHAAGWHGTVTDVGPAWTERLQAAKILGMESLGSGGVPSPGVGSYENTLRTAEAWNRLGKEAVEAGVGPVYIHNHTGEFDAKYVDNGVLKTAWQILIERTDPRYAFAEVDVFWSSDAFNDETGQKTADLINAYPTRVKLLHIKDGINVATQPSPTNSRGGSPQATGTGVVDFRPIFAAAKGKVAYYHQEHDGGTIADADTSFTNLKGVGSQSVATLLGYPTSFPTVAAGTPAAGNVVPVVIQNTGEKDLNIVNTTITGDNAGDFQVVSSTCGRYPGQPNGTPGVTLAPGSVAAGVARGTCTVTVGFKPTSTNKKSVAYLTFDSNSDNATENILLTGQSNANATSTVGGTVGTVLSLTLGAPGSFGAFQPAVARNYDATTQATVISTAGDAALSVSDPTTTAPGHLVNGAFSLAQPLQVRGNNAANTGTAFTALSETSNAATTLLSYSAPTAGADQVTINFRQAIGASDVLRAGSYSKTLTFTLSTTTP